jgi:hypothetical protein
MYFFRHHQKIEKMKLSEVISSPNQSFTNKRAVLLPDPSVFNKMWTIRESHSKIANGTLFEEFGNLWSDVMHEGEIQISELFLDSSTLRIIDPETKMIRAIAPDEVLSDLDVSMIGVGRAMGKLDIKGLHPDFNPSIAINFNELGEQIGYGINVIVCKNFTILGAERLISTYQKAHRSHSLLTLPQIKRQVKGWMMNSIEEFEKNQLLIAELKNTPVKRSDFERFMGQQFAKIEVANAFRVNRKISEITSEQKKLTINSRQLAKIAVEAYKPSHKVYDWTNDTTSKWNIVNYGTEHLKFERGSEFLNILTNNRDYVKLIQNHTFN